MKDTIGRVDQLMNIEHLEFADGIQPIADAITLSNAEPISHEFLSSFGTSSNDDTSIFSNQVQHKI